MIYFAQAEGIGHIKIGHTDSDDVLVRLAQLQTGCPTPLRLLGTVPGSPETEKDLHRRFAAHRVHGEWFKAVPELLALITPGETRACDGVEVVERSVTIRALTVGRRQFTRAILDQLPEGDPLCWPRIDRIATNAAPPTLDGDCDPWGWVHGGVYKQSYYCEYAGRSFVQAEYRWVIFAYRDGRLYKFRDHLRYSCFARANKLSIHDKLADEGHALRLALPGFRDQDQPFIGV